MLRVGAIEAELSIKLDRQSSHLTIVQHPKDGWNDTTNIDTETRISGGLEITLVAKNPSTPQKYPS